ncbi:MAG: hypothetical protein K5639_01655 [Eubacterium sp.]|nr:hypothetical protein [Eubacterium sp.]
MDALQLFEKALLTYDDKGGGNDEFYNSLPYERNYDLCNTIPIAPYSGNIIKFYQYRLAEPVIIFTDTVDTDFKEEKAETEAENEVEYMEDELGETEEFDGEQPEMSEEEMAALLTEDLEDEEVYEKPVSAPVDEYSDEYADEFAEETDDTGLYNDEEGIAEDWEAKAFDD